MRFQSPSDGTTLLLRPEDSIATQHKIGSDIIMMLDDVVHSCSTDMNRFKLATERTVRWLDRCIKAHEEGIPLLLHACQTRCSASSKLAQR